MRSQRRPSLPQPALFRTALTAFVALAASPAAGANDESPPLPAPTPQATEPAETTPSGEPEPPAESEAGITRLQEIVVTGRADSLIGVADSPSEGTVGADQLRSRPLLRPGEIAETVPGVIVTQHSGSGKANQFFLRGFNLDHGTDFATYVEGVPINLPSHAHGQGYTDLNFVIPELVTRVNFRKGPYYAEAADFSSTGEVRLEYVKSLPRSIARVEGGNFGYVRGLAAGSTPVGKGDLLYAAEVFHDDGPWTHPDNYVKLNGNLRWSLSNAENDYSLLATAYHGKWDATDQIAKRAVDQGLIGRLDSLDTTDGGESQRYGLTGQLANGRGDSRLSLLAYSYYYDLDLFSNFTYFLNDPVNGDQFEQKDWRIVSGITARQDWDGKFWWGRDVTTTVGAQFRNDFVHNGLFNTLSRDRLSTTRTDEIIETSFGLFFEHRTQWAEKFRSVVGVRGDLYNFDVDSNLHENSGNVTDFIPSPKASLIFGPWAETEFYLNGGFAFHSNDARGVTSVVDPSTGLPVSKADPLVRTIGAEVGVRTLALKDLQSTLTFWFLHSDSELLFVGDAGTTEPSRPSRRYGVEWANYWSPLEWLTLDFDAALSHARFSDSEPEGDYIPGSIESVVAAGITVPDLHGFFGSLRLRYFGPRPLIEDDSVRSSPTLLLNGQVGYRISEDWTVSCDVLNILNRKDNDIEYFYTSRLQGEPAAGVDDRHFHPVYPLTVRVALTAQF